nr:5230_t:CDS:2 [Entrophospora candida]
MAKKVLSYYDVILYEEDVKLFDDYNWINDQCIDFYIEYIENNFKQKANSDFQIFFLRPALIYLISNAVDTKYFKNVIPNQVFSSEIFFMIINNNLNVNQPRGGTHWSLLIYVKGLNTFFHFDSCHNMNEKIAKFNALKFSEIIKIQECGIYVLSFMDVLYKRFLDYSSLDKLDVEKLLEISRDDVLPAKIMRENLRNLPIPFGSSKTFNYEKNTIQALEKVQRLAKSCLCGTVEEWFSKNLASLIDNNSLTITATLASSAAQISAKPITSLNKSTADY